MKKFALLLLALAMLSGCASGTSEEPGPEIPPSAYIRDNTLEVRLEANPSTGYSWSFSPEGEGRVSLTSRSHQSADDSGLLDGVGGIELFCFAPESPGEGTLQFSYARPWEDKPPLETYAVNFAVREEDGELVLQLR